MARPNTGKSTPEKLEYMKKYYQAYKVRQAAAKTKIQSAASIGGGI